MLEKILRFFSPSPTFMPHGYCLSWQSKFVLLHVISDALIALAYLAIPATIYIFIRHKEKSLAHKNLFWLFAAFIVACAVTHIMGIVVIWWPYYLLQGLLMAITAMISVITALELARQMPDLLKMPTITQLQTINEELAQQIMHRALLEKKLRLTQFSIDNAGEGIYWINPDASILYANQAASEMLGYKLSEFLTLKISDLNPKQTDEKWRNYWQELKKHKTLSFEALLLKKDRTTAWFEITANFIIYEGFEYNCAFVRDISEQVATQQALLESRNILQTSEFMLKQAQEIAHVGHWILDFTTNHLHWSDEIYRILGIAPEKSGTSSYETFLDFVHPDDRALVDDTYQEHLRTQTDYNIVHRLLLNDGNIKYVNEKCKTSFNEQGQPLQSMGVVLDVTERKEAEQRISDLLDLNQKIISQSSFGVKVFNASGQCITCNEAAAKNLDKSVAQVLTENIYHSDFWQSSHLFEVALECLRQKSPQRYEIQVTLASGKKVWLDYHFATFNGNHETHLLVLIHDVSEYRQAEIALREAELIAVSANQAKSEFIANMSHEIRTPMNAILGFSSILDDLINDPTQHYYLDAIKRSGKTLLQLINDILDLSKIEAGKLSLQYSPVVLTALLDDIVIIFSPKAFDKSLVLQVEIPANLPHYLRLDEIRLRQILLNLVGNAVKFTDIGFVKIIVSLEETKHPEKINLIIEVCDSGVGIPANQQEKIFAAFTQQDNQTSHYGGTGLGLTICKRLLELMDGQISVESTPGKGSCFILRLNDIEIVDTLLQSPPMVSEPPPAPAIIHFQPSRILLVDDMPFNRLLVKSYLAEFTELHFTEAETGEQALQLLEQQTFNLIFMDRRLPGDDGDAICRQIRTLPRYAHTPIIMITASVLTVSEKYFPPAFDVQLDKPLNKDKLIAALQRFLPFATEQPHLTAEVVSSADDNKQIVDLDSLLVLLKTHYLPGMTKWSESNILDIDQMIEIGEQLKVSAEKHQCMALKQWAQQFVTEVELFDLNSLPHTMKNFNVLLKNLEQLL